MNARSVSDDDWQVPVVHVANCPPHRFWSSYEYLNIHDFVEVKTTSCSLRGHIGPLSHVDYWFENGFAFFEHVVQSQISNTWCLFGVGS
jgi:hypothetical protein